jgi:hypothetical protein
MQRERETVHPANKRRVRVYEISRADWAQAHSPSA